MRPRSLGESDSVELMEDVTAQALIYQTGLKSQGRFSHIPMFYPIFLRVVSPVGFLIFYRENYILYYSPDIKLKYIKTQFG